MLSPFRDYLKDKKILLASSSPRRKEILENMGLTFTVEKSTFEENLDKSKIRDPCVYVLQTAMCKTREVVERIIADKEEFPDIVIGADTVVYLDDEILEKPAGVEEAKVMLRKLNGKVHKVCTGVVVMVTKCGKINPPTEPNPLCDLFYDITSFSDVTEVQFDSLSEEVIGCYAESGESLDKAGGFGIQGLGGTLIRGIKGDYFNVMGLPANHLSRVLTDHIVKKITHNS